MEKTINVTCQGAALLKLEELIHFQGHLKTLSEAAYNRLRLSILEFGITFPLSIWRNNEKYFIIDAHQRVAVLKRMQAEGYLIPDLPVVWIEAASEQEAARKVLAATSQYGTVTPQGLFDFMKDFDLNLDNIVGSFQFPEIDYPSFKIAFFPNTETVSFEANTEWKGMPEFDHQNKEAFRSIVVHFHDQAGVEAFANLIKQNITEKTRMLWYPEIVIERAADKRYGNPKP